MHICNGLKNLRTMAGPEKMCFPANTRSIPLKILPNCTYDFFIRRFCLAATLPLQVLFYVVVVVVELPKCVRFY